MNRTRTPILLASLLVAVTVTACSAARGADVDPTQRPSSTPSQVPATPDPTAPAETPVPTVAPTGTPRPVATPGGRLHIGWLAEALADNVNVRILPGLDQPLIDEQNFDTGDVFEGVQLDAGDPVVIQLGPVLVDGMEWYAVSDHDGDRISWLNGGWVAGQYLTDIRRVESFEQPVVALEGAGVDASGSGQVRGGLVLSYLVIAAPTAGADRCDLEVTLTDVDGRTIDVVGTEVRDTTLIPQEAPQLPAQPRAGTVTFTVESDCAFAAILREQTQG
jgi:hypothetical protein